MATNKRKSEIKIVDLTQSSGGGGVTPSQMNEAISNAVGKGLEVGFDGTLKDNVLTFVPPESSGTYDLKEDYDYIVDLSFPAVGELDDSVEMEIENDGEMIQFFTITHTNVTTSATVADLKDVMKYDEATGYRWVFRARCHITSSSSIKCFVILPTVQPASSGGGVTEEELNSAIETHNTSTLSHEDIREKIENLELYKTPNAIIVGDPTINNGQVSNFSIENYLQFPSVVDLTDKDFEIDFSFTTDTGVQTQQNIIDSKFGIAIAIGSGHMILAMSSNGTSWDIANAEMGSYNIEPETTYYCKLTRDVESSMYELSITKDPISEYQTDITSGSGDSPYPRTIYIGGASQSAIGHTPTPFYGSINLNKAKLIIDGIEVWQGMDDVGLATRATKSLSNIDSDGVQKIIDSVPVATTSTLGKVKPDGTTITITDDGTITSVGGGSETPIATTETAGKVKPDGSTITVTTDGTISANTDDINEALTLLNGGESTLLGTKADTDLGNLSTTGQAVIDGKADISLSNLSDSGQAVIDGKADISLSNLSDSGQAVLDAKANIDLDNLSDTGKTVLDGQWTNKHSVMISDVSMTSSTVNTYSLSDYLPDDGYNYEVYCIVGGRTGTTSGNSIQIWLGSSLLTSRALVAYTVTRTTSYAVGGGCAIIPIGSDRNLILAGTNLAGTATNVWIHVQGYRRIGTNS